MSEFQPTTAIRKIIGMTASYRVIMGGTSAGKTYAIMAILIDTACNIPGKKIDVVSQTYDHLDGGAIADFKSIMMSVGKWRDEQWHDTKHTYTFRNKSFIRFKALDTEGKARGPRRDILYVNEANLINFEIFNQLKARTNDYIYIDYNPSNKFWVDDEILPSPNAQKLILTYRDNETLSQRKLDEFAENRKKAETSDYWRNWCDVYLDGKSGVIQGTIFNNWRTIDHIPVEAKLIGYGMDFGFTNDPTTCVAVYNHNDVIILDQIIYQRGLHPSDISTLLKQNNVSGEIYADGARPEIISEIKGYGYNIKRADKGKGSILLGLDLMQQVNFLVTNRSEELKTELTFYAWRKNLDGSQLNEPIDKHNHCIDGVRYLFIMKMGKNKVVDPRYFKVYDSPMGKNNGMTLREKGNPNRGR